MATQLSYLCCITHCILSSSSSSPWQRHCGKLRLSSHLHVDNYTHTHTNTQVAKEMGNNECTSLYQASNLGRCNWPTPPLPPSSCDPRLSPPPSSFLPLQLRREGGRGRERGREVVVIVITSSCCCCCCGRIRTCGH